MWEIQQQEYTENASFDKFHPVQATMSRKKKKKNWR